ncbi:hypothetical protein [Chamaesiphon polymorphus]|uniref:Uncharacterized protein n=1 Tax=Chamaesiphon polymorphus CCALA 037 TaxID=2107692 RepID=A0A2T1GHK2_9CYAN|nr:hypothetical protein [Chamaesiphon polymorphus]PSB57187.1 hypothetical protein C7B77_09235 [Chamaesiphon polymorphus CCALA 037]
MPKTVVILDETPDSQRLGVAMLGAIGELVDSVQFLAVAELPAVADPKAIYCPLTLDVPPTFEFWGRSIGRSCQEIDRLRDLAAITTDVKVGDGGNLWLPVIWTAKDPIYGEVIGGMAANRDRQPLYRFGERLLTELSAPPATYLVQLSQDRAGIIFDRLFPFPAIPVLGSVKQPLDLFDCHWRCITNQ